MCSCNCHCFCNHPKQSFVVCVAIGTLFTIIALFTGGWGRWDLVGNYDVHVQIGLLTNRCPKIDVSGLDVSGLDVSGPKECLVRIFFFIKQGDYSFRSYLKGGG